MPTTGSVQEFIKERKKQKKEALAQLNAWKQDPITLKRPVFFVPGWTDEDCKCWSLDEWNKKSSKTWFSDIATNANEAYFITFIEESKDCASFLDFGKFLRNKIWDVIGKNTQFDIVGHSMGGLDIRAAIIQEEPLLNINKCVTVSTPHQGDNLGGLNWWLIRRGLRKMSNPHAEQGKNLDPDYPPITLLNQLENRKLFLERIVRLYQLKGTKDFCVKGSAIMKKEGVESLCDSKSDEITVEGADHTGKIGICKDPRTILTIVKILLDINLPKPDFNYGYILKS